MTTYAIRDKQTLTYRRSPWSNEAIRYVTRWHAERVKAEHEEVVAVSSRPLVPLRTVPQVG